MKSIRDITGLELNKIYSTLGCLFMPIKMVGYLWA